MSVAKVVGSYFLAAVELFWFSGELEFGVSGVGDLMSWGFAPLGGLLPRLLSGASTLLQNQPNNDANTGGHQGLQSRLPNGPFF